MSHATWVVRMLRAVAVVCMGLSGAAWAQAPWTSLSLTFLEPTGVVGPTDSIPVNLRFTNNDATLDFVVDNSLPNGGLDTSFLPTTGQYFDASDPTCPGGYCYQPFDRYTDFSLTIGFGCSGTFTAPGMCTNGPPYTFEFAANPFNSLPFTLAAGSSTDYLFGTFVPSSGPVAAGTYEFYRSVVWLNVGGYDVAGHALSAVVFPALTCTGDSAAACASVGYFSRVVAVPEPGTYALMGLGFGLLGWRLRRRVAAG